MALLKRIWNRLTWQRMPVDEFSIKQPGREVRTALLYSVFFIFAAVVTGTGIPVLIVGLIFGLLWDRYRSILPLIAAHWGVDTLPAIIAFLGIDY